MHMILIGADLDEPDFVAFLDFKANVFQCSLYRFGKGFFSVFHGTNQVVEKECFVVALGDVFAHPKRVHLRAGTPHSECEVSRNETACNPKTCREKLRDRKSVV